MICLLKFYFRKRAENSKPPSPNPSDKPSMTPSNPKPLGKSQAEISKTEAIVEKTSNELGTKSAPQEITDKSDEPEIVKPVVNSEDVRTSELEPGELASDSSVKSSSEEDETPNQTTEKEDHYEPTAPLPTSLPASSPLMSVDLLLDYCRSQLSFKASPRPPPSLQKPTVEFNPISRPTPEFSIRSHSRYQPYRSPLTAFRSYRYGIVIDEKKLLTVQLSFFGEF